MRAYVHRVPGRGAVQEVPTPQPSSGEVRVRVSAAGLNHLDVFARHAVTGPGIRGHTFPHVSGCDVAGVIDAAGPDVEGWRPGDRVVVYPGIGCGSCEFCRRGDTSSCPAYRIWGEQTWGGLAEYAVAPADNLMAVPAGFDLGVAAAAPVAYTTAWQALVTAGALRAGETVLIVGIGGGVATAALTIARHAGARVLVTSGQDRKLERAAAMGAESGVNHARHPFDTWVRDQTGGRGVDLVLDSAGAATWRRSIRSLAPGGRMCVCGATSGDRPDISIRELYQAHRRIIGAPLGGRPTFDTVMALVFAGALRPAIDAVYPLTTIEHALSSLEESRQFGKIVITP
ncbi:MAG: alcohol dehydrogenase catalytic domain-containing protein [Carbonactinosporaceae bacterium]